MGCNIPEEGSSRIDRQVRMDPRAWNSHQGHVTINPHLGSGSGPMMAEEKETSKDGGIIKKTFHEEK